MWDGGGGGAVAVLHVVAVSTRQRRGIHCSACSTDEVSLRIGGVQTPKSYWPSKILQKARTTHF